MKTIAYVDGYNLYHGRLKNQPYKWLDLRALLAEILKGQDPASELVAVKFYTAMIKSSLARRGHDSANAQKAYHRALEAKGVEVITGRFSLDTGQAPVRIEGQKADRDQQVDIWVLSEKETDVRLALGMYRDVSAGHCDQILLATNDSDLSPALEAIRQDHPSIRVGVLFPRPKTHTARVSASLSKQAHWTRHHITDEELSEHQFPDRVGTRKKPVDKPAHW